MPVAELQGQLIGGERVAALDGERFEVLDPSTGDHIADVPRSKAADVDRAVAAARSAFVHWRRVIPSDRGRLLTNVARRLREEMAEIARLGALDGGLPLPAVQRDVEATARYFEYYGGLADKIGGDVVPLGEGFLDYTEREPFGVCAVILPFNSPFQIVARSVAPALAAGNAVVVKAAEQAPLGPLRLADVLAAEGLPPGVLNIITGFGGEAGTRLVEHPDVDRITFTGSEATGRLVMDAGESQPRPRSRSSWVASCPTCCSPTPMSRPLPRPSSRASCGAPDRCARRAPGCSSSARCTIRSSRWWPRRCGPRASAGRSMRLTWAR